MSLDVLDKDQLRRRKIGSLLGLKPVLEKSFIRKNSSLSAYGFPGLFGWLDFFDFEIREMRDTVCVFAGHPLGTFMYFPPMGPAVSPETVRECFALMEERNGGKGVSRIENAGPEDMGLFDRTQFDVVLKGHDYCYSREDIAGLKGGSFKSRRSSYNRFVKNYPFAWRPFEPSMRFECIALYDRWAEYKRGRATDEVYRHMLDENRPVHDVLMEHSENLGLTGRVVCVGGRITGYTFGFALNSTTFCVLLEITDPAVKGLPAFIFREFCRDPELQPYPFINAMDDFGMAGVAQTKRLFRPVFLLPSYVISRKDRR